MKTRYEDRIDAGRKLAELLEPLRSEDVVVLGLPRGGVPVAAEVARALGKPLDVLLVRKLGVPGNEELAMGAIASGGIRVLNHDVMSWLQLQDEDVDLAVAAEQVELERRAAEYRGDRPPPRVAGKTVVLVDDGLATGATMRAAVEALRQLLPRKIVVAVPVAPPSTCAELEEIADQVVCARTPESFRGVGQWYEDFSPTSDAEVRHALAGGQARPLPGEDRVEDIDVPSDGIRLAGTRVVPAGARGIVLFAHGSGSGRHSPRNRFVASALNARGMATLLLDLLSEEEEEEDRESGHLRFDIAFLARRLESAADFLAHAEHTRGLPLGLFGASTGAAAALVAAAHLPHRVAAVVSRGGRPDLAGDALARVRAPTRLIVGGEDGTVLELNQLALEELRAPEKDLAVVPGAGHLFERPRELQEVAQLAAEWFERHFSGGIEVRPPVG